MKKSKAVAELELVFEQIQRNELTNPGAAAIRVVNAIGAILDESTDKAQFEQTLNRATDALVAHGYKKRPIHSHAANLFKEQVVWIKAFVESWKDIGYPVPQGTNPHLELTLRVPGAAGELKIDTAYATVMSDLSRT